MDEEITVEDLRQYQAIVKEIQALEAEIAAIYIESPGPKENVGGRASVRSSGDPTHRKALRAIERKEKLEKKQQELEGLIDRIDSYIDHMTDHHVAAIIRWHFVRGLSWRQTCVKIYGYPDPDICRMTVWRYFKSKEIKNDNDRQRSTAGDDPERSAGD